MGLGAAEGGPRRGGGAQSLGSSAQSCAPRPRRVLSITPAPGAGLPHWPCGERWGARAGQGWVYSKREGGCGCGWGLCPASHPHPHPRPLHPRASGPADPGARVPPAEIAAGPGIPSQNENEREIEIDKSIQSLMSTSNLYKTRSKGTGAWFLPGPRRAPGLGEPRRWSPRLPGAFFSPAGASDSGTAAQGRARPGRTRAGRMQCP